MRNSATAWWSGTEAMKPTKAFKVRAPAGDPLVAQPEGHWAITAAALTSKLWLVKQDASGQWTAKEVATIGDPSKVPLPSISASRATARACGSIPSWTARRATSTCPSEAPKQTYEKVTGKQINMISQSWDGKRLSSPRRCSPTGT